MCLTFKERLQHFLRSQRISNVDFVREMEVSPTYLRSMRKAMPYSKINRMKAIWPQLNVDWLIDGKGEMLDVQEEKGNEPRIAEGHCVPLLPVAAFAGNLQMWSAGVRRSDCNMVVSPVRDADFAIPVSGDSMEPDFTNGQTLFIKKINDKAFIPWGNALVIDTENGVLLKDLFPDEDNQSGYLVAKSRNVKYPPFRIPLDSIFGIYRVVGAMSLFSMS